MESVFGDADTDESGHVAARFADLYGFPQSFRADDGMSVFRRRGFEPDDAGDEGPPLL